MELCNLTTATIIIIIIIMLISDFGNENIKEMALNRREMLGLKYRNQTTFFFFFFLMIV